MTSLDKLSEELFNDVCRFVPANDLWFGLRPTSRRISAGLRRERYWTDRSRRNYGVYLPKRIQSEPTDNNPRQEIVGRHYHIARDYKWWNSEDSKPISLDSNCKHNGTVDAIKIFRTGNKRFCLTGGRDRMLLLLDLEAAADQTIPSTECVSCSVDNVHKGWIWSISTPSGDPSSSTVFTASWDKHVVQWLLAEGKLSDISKVKLSEAVLNVYAATSQIFYVSTYRRGPVFFDMRMGTSPIKTLACHGNASVFGLTTNPDKNIVYTCGEDNRVVAVDLRMFMEIHQQNFGKGNPMISHIDYNASMLAMSFRNGLVKFLNPDTFDLENEFCVASEHERWGNPCIKISKGAVYVTTPDSKLDVFTPGLNPKLIKSIPMESNITQIDYCKGDLMAALGLGDFQYFSRHK